MTTKIDELMLLVNAVAGAAVCDYIRNTEGDTQNTAQVYKSLLELAMRDLFTDAQRYQYLRNHVLPAGHGSFSVHMDDRCGTGNFNREIFRAVELDEELDKLIAKWGTK